ncbi:MAG TPA: hypothetical protein VN914_13905 [Polyangia bacterium]|nr:hypothetical protein [Polyangia bacterium]
MTDAQQLITDGVLIEEMKRAIWRDDARHAGVAEADIERSVFLRWRIARAGGPQVAVYGLGRIQAAGEEAG